MGKGKSEYKERGCGAERENVPHMRKKLRKPVLASTFSTLQSVVNEQHEDIVESTADGFFVFVKSYQR
jgi:hypothetical protein